MIDCEQTWHPLWTQLSHWQMFMKYSEYTAIWDLQFLCYLTQLQFAIDQNDFMDFLMFSGTTWAIWVFSVISVYANASKASIRCCRYSRVQITLWSHSFSWTAFFPIKKQCLINTWNSFSSIVFKQAKVPSLKCFTKSLMVKYTRKW